MKPILLKGIKCKCKDSLVLFLFFLFVACNPTDSGVSLPPKPEAPTLSLTSPETTNSDSSAIVITAAAAVGSTVKIYSDSACS